MGYINTISKDEIDVDIQDKRFPDITAADNDKVFGVQNGAVGMVAAAKLGTDGKVLSSQLPTIISYREV